MKISKVVESTLGSHEFIIGIFNFIATLLVLSGLITGKLYHLVFGLSIWVIDLKFTLKELKKELKDKKVIDS